VKVNVELVMLDETGREVWRHTGHNVITTVGRDKLFETAAPKHPKDFCYLAIGSGVNVPVVGDVALQTELARSAVPIVPVWAGHVLTFTETFGPGVGTGNICEAGLFDATPAGTLLSRVACASTPKLAGNTLIVTYQLT
jgi:hypothetical protein